MPEAKPIRRLTPEQQQLATDNMGLVYQLAHRYKWAKILSFDDLVGEGCLALTRYVVPGYKPKYGKFSTYAIPAIARYMKRALRNAEKHRHYQEAVDSDNDDADRPDLDQLPDVLSFPTESRHDLPDIHGLLGDLTDLERAVVEGRHGLREGRARSWPALALELRQPAAKLKAVYDRAMYNLRIGGTHLLKQAA